MEPTKTPFLMITFGLVFLLHYWFTLNVQFECVFHDGRWQLRILRPARQILSAVFHAGHKGHAAVADVTVRWRLKKQTNKTKNNEDKGGKKKEQ